MHEDVAIFWHKKKISPNKKPFSLKEKKPGEGDAGQAPEDTPFQHSPLGKPTARVTASSLVTKRCAGLAHRLS